jgi:hypothetical protein
MKGNTLDLTQKSDSESISSHGISNADDKSDDDNNPSNDNNSASKSTTMTMMTTMIWATSKTKKKNQPQFRDDSEIDNDDSE